MAFPDDITNKTMSEMRERFDELRSMEMRGQLDDKGREELQELRKRFSGENR